VLFVAQALLGIPVFIILVPGLVALSVAAVAALIDLPDISAR
jgi:hypothetical protein